MFNWFKPKRPPPLANPLVLTALPDHWVAIDSDESARMFEHELARECVRGHPLYGLASRAIAREDGHDDTLFILADGRAAIVHLTYAAESEPRWPHCRLYSSVLEAIGDLAPPRAP